MLRPQTLQHSAAQDHRTRIMTGWTRALLLVSVISDTLVRVSEERSTTVHGWRVYLTRARKTKQAGFFMFLRDAA